MSLFEILLLVSMFILIIIVGNGKSYGEQLVSIQKFLIEIRTELKHIKEDLESERDSKKKIYSSGRTRPDDWFDKKNSKAVEQAKAAKRERERTKSTT